ncbi:nucleotide-diphospho-sugar transferase [Polychytrium aggregatum]|uniref:nucleotide-diphospho-sugar transferase n=1 Tax=Polychytrium aggregatum TaxID=110093 RepID=UPI0022FDB0D0|nr:nucleotide-diphospho-sugar transferase [Polychytrium aggregatum]KAI9208643.1 nucleotide-diphospho-sugar transferase [Polychytrium aggregatum]
MVLNSNRSRHFALCIIGIVLLWTLWYLPQQRTGELAGWPASPSDHILIDPGVGVSIPKIIHQSWKTEALPKKFVQWSDSWKQHHPTWTYILWTDDMNRKFIETSFPWFLDTYDALPKNINRADASRYFYMYKYGGVYADLDMECLRAMDAPVVEGGPALIERGSALISFMGLDTQFEHSLPNAWMASAPGHPFWMFVVNEIMRAFRRSDANTTAEELAGPVVLFRTYSNHNDIQGYIYPYSWANAHQIGAICSAQSPQFNGSACKLALGAEGKPGQQPYTITYWSHSWGEQQANSKVLDD